MPQTEGVSFGDLNAVIAAELAAGLRRVGTAAEMSMNRLDAIAQKSAFEVDANETGLSNAQFPRPNGGSTTANGPA